MTIDEIVSKITQFAASFSWGPIVLLVLGLLGSMCVLATLVVAATPTKTDDEMLEKIENGGISGLIWKVLVSFSIIRKK